MEIQQQLRALGLHHTEVVVYLFLLKNGLSSPPVVSHETNITRTNCYNILVELKNKGLIEEKVEAKRKVYQANDPTALVDLLKRKVADAQKILPDLQAVFTRQVISPGVKFYQGLAQIKELYEGSLSTKAVFSAGSREKFRALLPDFEKYYFQEIQKRQIVFYDLTDQKSKLMTAKMREFLKGYYSARQLPPEYEEAEMDMLMWNDTVCFLHLKDPAMAIVIENQPISNLIQMLFKIVWQKM